MRKNIGLYVLEDYIELLSEDRDNRQKEVRLKYHLIKKDRLHKRVYGFNIYSNFCIQNNLNDNFTVKYRDSFYSGCDIYNIKNLNKSTSYIEYSHIYDYDFSKIKINLWSSAEKYIEKWMRKHTKFLSNIYNYISRFNAIIMAPEYDINMPRKGE